MHNEELHNLHASLDTVTVIMSKRMRWVGQAAYMGEMRNAHKIVRKPEVMRLHGRHRHILQDNIRIDLI
jgi:hypothetical protein